MPLNAAQRAQLHAAFTDAFNHAELAQLVLFCFGVPLHNIVAPGSLEYEVTQLITWAGRDGTLRTLVEGACEERRGHVVFCVEARGWDLDAPWPLDDDDLHGGELPPEPPGPPAVFVGRGEELNWLYGRLGAVRSAGQGRLLFVYGPAGVGKRELVRQWLTDLESSEQPPLIARTTFLPAEMSELARQEHYRNDSHWTLDWTRFGDDLRRYFPKEFQLGGYPWVALAVQLAARCPRVRAALSGGHSRLDELRSGAEGPPIRAVTELLRLAARDGERLIVVLEQFQHASTLWDTLLLAWVREIALSRLPILLVVEHDYPLDLDHADAAHLSDRLRWFQGYLRRPEHRDDLWRLAPLTRWQVADFLAHDSQDWAVDLHSLTDGMPSIIEQLLHHWRGAGRASCDGDGLWHVHHAADIYPGALYDDLIAAPLAAAAERAQGLGYALSADDLLGWLNYAVWEGDVFTDDALARALGWPRDAIEDFQTVLDEALCARDEEPGVIEELDETVALPYGDGQVRYCARYRFHPPIVAAILRQLQSVPERQEQGQKYAQALLAAYAPHRDRILGQLIPLYDAIGLPNLAASYRLERQVGLTLEAMEAELQVIDALTDEVSRRLLLTKLKTYLQVAYSRRHPAVILLWAERALVLARSLADRASEGFALNIIGLVNSALGEKARALEFYEHALELVQQVRERGGEATTLNNIGLVYSDLGETVRALETYEQALPLLRQVGDRGGEAATLHNIGKVYSVLGEQVRALEYYEQALLLVRQVGDRGGEAVTLNNIGVVYRSLGEPARALESFEQALPLLRQVGDRWGEKVARFNIGMAAAALGDLDRAVQEMEQAVALDEAIGHPDLASDRAALERMRARRAAAPGGQP